MTVCFTEGDAMSVEVSLIFAVHNGEYGLKNALDSVKKLKIRDIEVIMVDAASDDNTQRIMSSYTDKRFSYHRIDSTKICDARNRGLELAQGKFVAFADNNVSFSSGVMREMVDCATRHRAEMCVSRMASSDIYGRHDFSSTGQLSHRSRTNSFDTDLIWNPAVSNKIFRLDIIRKIGLRFNDYGKAQDAAFSLPFAFNCSRIACCDKGYTIYSVPYADEGIAKASIMNYIDAYNSIVAEADLAFDEEIRKAETDFDRREIEKQRICYIDTLRCKEITVLLYSYYRHFWKLEKTVVEHYTQLISGLFSTLSAQGKALLHERNADIFYDDILFSDRKELSANPKATVCIGRCDDRGHFTLERMKIELDSVYGQTMPSFELFVDLRLKEFVPDEYIECENLTFIDADSISDFKQKALEKSSTEYIMFLDGFVRLNPKILMRHYNALNSSGDRYGFTTSPLTRFDGEHTQSYKFSDYAFFKNLGNIRTSDSDSYCLDLFFCNKLFRVRHLKGIHFVFTDNTLFDMYKLYELCRFKKLSHRGTYFPYNEDEVMGYLLSQAKHLPTNCGRMFKKYRRAYFKYVDMNNAVKKVKRRFARYKKYLISRLGIILRYIYGLLPIQKRVFFYTIRADGKLLENSKLVYDALDCKKVVYAKMLPHSSKDLIKIYYYLLTSKVIVTDDYLKYLRIVRLRPGQKVIQVWHAGGAFKRFGLDAPSKLTKLEEYKTHSQYTDVCVTSEYVRQFYAHAFGIDIDVVKAIGSPRTDQFFNKDVLNKLRENIYEKHPVLRDKKVYVYLPTFREKKGNRIRFEPQIDWDELDSALGDDEIFVISRHPVMKYEYIKDKHYSRLKDYTADPTPELLSVADVIITDYSSVIFDASLIDCPTVFYCPDFDDYDRDFYLDYPDDLPGPVVYEADNLLGTIRDVRENPPKQQIAEFLEKEMSACDGHSTERIAALAKSYLKN